MIILNSFTRSVLRRCCAVVCTSPFSSTALLQNEIRLSKRMSELGMCSNREAKRILKEASEHPNTSLLKEVIYLRGRPVLEGTGATVPKDEKYIEIRRPGDASDNNDDLKEYVPYVERSWHEICGDTIVLNKPIGYVSGQEEHQHVPSVRLLTASDNNDDLKEYVPYVERSWHEICGDTIVLNKPIGYVSGQEEHQHVPAVRLLTRSNYLPTTTDDDDVLRSSLQFTKKKWSGLDLETSSIPKHIRNSFRRSDEASAEEKEFEWEATLSGYAVAGRLDVDSTGILIFTRSGMVAKRLISPDSTIHKEYIVKVTPAVRLTTREREMGMKRLPPTTTDLEPLLQGGRRLWNDPKPLKPVVEAEWLKSSADEQTQQIRTLRLVLQEGKKRQIRRMCRELLGCHVVELERTAIGPVKIDSLPQGKWRTLTREEVQELLVDCSAPKKRKKKKRSPTRT
ncbi:hypothetical protein ACHAWC_010492 [Mediolabrus comicus]